MKVSILLLLFHFLTTISSGQTIKGTYKIYPTDSKFKDYDVSMTRSYLYSQNISFEKLIAGKGAVLQDTLILDDNGTTHDVHAKFIRPTDVFIYKDFSKNIFKMQFDKNKEVRAIQDTIPKYTWDLHNETKELIGYPCKKATTTVHKEGRNLPIVAWYTEKIPISDGPQDYTGLPGLILEVRVSNYTVLKMEQLTILKNKLLEIPEPTLIAPLTFSQYNTIYKHHDTIYMHHD